jgi:hypothetical protein
LKINKERFEEDLRKTDFDIPVVWEDPDHASILLSNDPLEPAELLGLLRIASLFEARLEVAGTAEKKVMVTFWFDEKEE